MHQSLAILKVFFRYNYVIMVSYFFGLIHLYFDFDRYLGCRPLLRTLQPLSSTEGIAIHIVNELVESILLPGLEQANDSQSIHCHLAHIKSVRNRRQKQFPARQ